MIDYKVLLWKYLNHIGFEESVTYVHRASAKDHFTPDEIEALEEIEGMDQPEWAQ